MSSQEIGVWSLNIKSRKGRVVLRGDIEKDESGSLVVFTEQASSASQITAAKSHGHYIKTTGMRRTSSRCSIRLYPGQNGRCTDVTENSKVRTSRYLDTFTETQMDQIMVQYGRPSCSSWAESVRSSFGRTIMGKAIWESPVEIRLGKSFQFGMLIRRPWKRVILICVCGWHKNWLERDKILIRCGKYNTKKLIWENQHLSLIRYTWDALKDNVK